MTVNVDFEPVGRRGECPEGGSLLDCARHLGVELVNLCGGSGSCGRCRVQVLAGSVSEARPAEAEFITPRQLADGYRLACLTIPLDDCKMRVPSESLTTPQRTQVEGEEVPVAPDSVIKTYDLQLEAASLDDLRADAGRLLATLAQQEGIVARSVDLGCLRQISPHLRAQNWQARIAVREGEIIALLPLTAQPLGLAVDLGTTKIAAYLVDLESGRTLASRGIMNPQIAYGEDVISRMVFANGSQSQAVRLQELVAEALNQSAHELCASVGAEADQIVDSVLVANTAMHHLFLRLPVAQLAQAPYVPAVDSALDIRARELGLAFAPGANVHLLPNIAGYVGADHVAMLLAIGLHEAEGVVLALDIGTNTEICLTNQGRLTSLSCASGPAFEGAHIKFGMRAADGAIEHVRMLDDQIELQTIGGAPAAGLCGSGILDTLAQLLQVGIVDARGRMGLHAQVRLGGDGIREFVLVDRHSGDSDRPDITFTQKDVRELQLAKGAMQTGITVLLEEHGLSEDEIDRVIIAGAFGSYIDVSSAIAINLLPSLPLSRFRQVGNAAGMGAKRALISRAERARAQSIADRVGYIELATVPGFTRTFAESMYLG